MTTKLLVLVLVCVAMLATGCSRDGDEPEAASPERTPTEAATATTATTATMETVSEPGLGEDLNDVGGPLDLELASAVRIGDLLAVSVTTYEGWEDDLLAGPRLDKQGPNRLTILYDTDLDDRADYTGKVVFAEGALSLVIAGEGQAFEPVPVERPDNATAQAVHPVDIFLVQAEGEGETDIQVAIESSAAGFKDRIPTEGWIVVPFAPA